MTNHDTELRIKQLEELLEAKTMQLDAVTQELNDLSFAVSHDLKAPIRAIAGFAGILLEEEADQLSDEGKRVIGVIQKNVQKLSVMLTEMLSYSSLSKKNVSLTMVHMHKIVTDIQASILSEREQQLLTISVAEIHSCQADENMMKQVWINLLNMALLCAEKNGFFQLSVTSEKQEEQIVYMLAVNNTMPGINSKNSNALKHEIVNRESLEGNGTGMAFVKRAVFKHKGHFWVQSVPGLQFVFNISLPLQ